MILRCILAFACVVSGLAIGQRLFRSPVHLALPRAVETELDGTVLSAANPIAQLRAAAREAISVGSAKPRPEVSDVASGAGTIPQAPDLAVAPSRPWNLTVTSLAPSDDARRAMTRDLQAELTRLGCYTGPADGRWSGALAASLRSFTGAVNAVLPTDGPDYALLTLARGHAPGVCNPSSEPSIPAEADALIGAVREADGFALGGDSVTGPPSGRMALGAMPPSAREAISTKLPERRLGHDVERLFVHPLGQ